MDGKGWIDGNGWICELMDRHEWVINVHGWTGVDGWIDMNGWTVVMGRCEWWICGQMSIGLMGVKVDGCENVDGHHEAMIMIRIGRSQH